MQQPTCTNVRIRSTADAHKIFGAIQQGLLHMVTRRLDAEERLALRSGCVYAWEERGPHSEITGLGIERFTEGRRWSPSRVRDEFLFYYEKYSPPADVNNIGNPADRHPPRDWDQLVKQTYSVWVETDKGRRKWHLTAYFTQATMDHLGTIDNISRVRDVVVTEGMFKSTRVGRRARADEESRSDARVGTRTYAAFPSHPYQHQGRSQTPNTNPVLMHEPYQRSDQLEYFRNQVESSAPYSQRTPSLSPTSPTTSGQYYGELAPYYSGPSHSSLSPTSPTSGQYYGELASYAGPSRSSLSPTSPTTSQYYGELASYSVPFRGVRSNSYADHRNPHGDSEDQSSLAPLDELRRSRYRREPSDEKTLRLLISGQLSP